MEERQIEISADSEAYIQSQLGRGDYADASDYIECLIREDRLTREALQKHVAKRRDQLEKLMAEGLNSGEPISVDAKYWAKQRQRLTDEFGGSRGSQITTFSTEWKKTPW